MATTAQLELREKVIEHIKFLEEHDPSAYNMKHWYQNSLGAECGTSACLAGWTCQLSGTPDKLFSGSYESRARELLGLTHAQSAYMFYHMDATGADHELDFKEILNDPDVDLYVLRGGFQFDTVDVSASNSALDDIFS